MIIQSQLPDGPIFVDLCFHLISSRNVPVVGHFPHGVVLDHRARFKEGAGATLVEGLTLCHQSKQQQENLVSF